jgi:hypothetical protein
MNMQSGSGALENWKAQPHQIDMSSNWNDRG